jgi:peptide/nickel transport system substrate-binding protein
VTTVPTRWGRVPALTLLAALLLSAPALAEAPVETPYFADKVAKKELPPVGERVPKAPLVVDLAARGRSIGKSGGEVVSLVGRARDIRYLSASSYARLVGYDEKLALGPDLLEKVDVADEERAFTLHLRPGHRWSDGHPFTTEDFRYFWEDVAGSKDLSPAGPPEFMLVDGKPPKFEVIGAATVRYAWDKPNPRFLPQLAAARDPFIYRPGALSQAAIHAKFADKAQLDERRRSRSSRTGRPCTTARRMNEQSNPTCRPCSPGA